MTFARSFSARKPNDSALPRAPGENKVEPEIIKDSQGHIVAEIREENGSYLVWKREKPSFPPTSRHTFLGSAKSIEEARQLAKTVIR